MGNIVPEERKVGLAGVYFCVLKTAQQLSFGWIIFEVG